MKAEIITIGDELLIGQTVNTNSAWMGAELSRMGFIITRSTTIPDNRESIIRALADVTGKVDVVLITGGLGPTSDDITKLVMCEYFDTVLVTNQEVLGMIELMVERRNQLLNDNNRRQADVPESCRVLFNATGTAPGMWFEKGGTIFVSMPGVPLEMKYIMNEHVLPEIRKRFSSGIIVHRNIMTYGTYEARLAELLSDFEAQLPSYIKLAYLPSLGVIKLRLTGSGKNHFLLSKEIELQVRKIYDKIPQYIYGEGEVSIEEALGILLKERHLKICTAESCTGGRISQMITSVPGSSAYYTGSVIAYDNLVKLKLLGVNKSTIENHGAVSRETAEEMAAGALKLFGCDFAVAVTGIAGPSGGSEEKPAGTAWIAVASAGKITSERHRFINDRNVNIRRFAIAAVNMLRLRVIENEVTSPEMRK